MALQFIGIDPETDGNDCPTVWVDDATGDYVLKGWRIPGPLAPAEAAPGHGEVVMRFPARMAQFFCAPAGAEGVQARAGTSAESATVALQFIGIGHGTDGEDRSAAWVDDTTGDLVLRGREITDPVTLAEAAPDHREVVMWFPARMAQFFQEVAGARRGSAV
jgi:hypothetical protein